MKKKNFIVVSICLLLVFIVNGCSLFKARKPSTIEAKKIKQEEFEIPEPVGKLTVGEKFSYKVRWLGLDVGRGILSIKNKAEVKDKHAYHIELCVSTNKFFSFFYHVKGTIESFLEEKTLRPIKYNSQTIIQKKKIFKKMEYDYEKKLVYAEDKKGKYELEISNGVLDPLGIFYYFRNHPVIFNEPINLLINGGKKNFRIRIYVRKKRRINTPAGRFWAFQVKPTKHSERQFDDSLNAPGSMTIWFSADERRIPLIITLRVPFGTAQATLIKSEFQTLN